VVFIENYDMNVARYLVQGVDVWLNTPRRGMEASGTSGMKVLCNGGLNMSVLDGWWCEGYGPGRGWAIGQGEGYSDREYQDEVESHAIYDLLEKDVIPRFYNRGADRLPRSWLAMMKNSMRELVAQFSTSRMVAEYAQGFYLPSAVRWEAFTQDDLHRAKALSDWKESIRDRWSEVTVGKVDIINEGELLVGGRLQVRCQVKLDTIEPSDVTVELYQGLVDSEGNIQRGEAVAMDYVGAANDGYHIFAGYIPCRHSGMCGFAVRVIPFHADLADKYDTGLICWEDTESESRKAKTVKPS
jgi:glycogen phosphorylase